MTNVQRIRPRIIQRFNPLQRTLHWLMAVCILAMLFIGVGMVSTVASEYLTLVNIHKPLGILILILALIRLVVRLRYGAPPLPLDLPEPMKLAAYLSHYALYALMIAMPLIGWAMLSAAEYPVVIWPGIWLPQILPLDPSLHTLLWNAHFYLAFLFFALILMHLSAALFHALIRRDGVFDAMGPRLTHDEIAPADWREGAGVCSIEVAPLSSVRNRSMIAQSPAGDRTAPFGSNQRRHCKQSEAIQGNWSASRLLDRRVASLLAMTILAERSTRRSALATC